MKIKNGKQLIENAEDETLRKMRKDAIDILEYALDAVDPRKAIENKVRIRDNSLEIDGISLNLDEYQRILVVGGGKAGGVMSEAVEGLLGDRITGGAVNVLAGTEGDHSLKKIRLNGAQHPVPDKRGVEGVERMLTVLKGMGEGDLVLALISGGGSALMPYPARGISLVDIQDVTKRLLLSGATINELNAVRKHLSAFKGGQLARRCHPARVVSLILSDVVGDPLDAIASGPTAPDPTTFQDAEEILKRYGLWEVCPEPVRERIINGVQGGVEETPKTDDPVFKKVSNVVVAGNLTAAEAACARAGELGYNPLILSTFVEGEARHVGSVYAGIAREIYSTGRPVEPPVAIIVGGETTVTVIGDGVGGRNQELALSSSRRIEGLDVVIAALATDGIDGPSEAAGAIVDGETAGKARARGLAIEDYLMRNDSYSFFKEIGDTLLTGPTGTNVNDLAIMLADS